MQSELGCEQLQFCSGLCLQMLKSTVQYIYTNKTTGAGSTFTGSRCTQKQ